MLCLKIYSDYADFLDRQAGSKMKILKVHVPDYRCRKDVTLTFMEKSNDSIF